MSELFGARLSVINVGLASFAESISATGGSAFPIDWRPPTGGADVANALAGLVNNPTVERANRTAFERFSAASPLLMGVDLARNVLPGFTERTILHAGPPVAWAEMCGPMQGAIIGAILYEGWAADSEEALALVDRGEVDFRPAHHCAAVGPMAGIVSPGMPVWCVANSTHGNVAYSTLNEGLGRVLRFGANDKEVIDRLRWMRDVLAPALVKSLEISGPLELKPLMAQALHMGDEVHNRNVAASSLFLKKIVPSLIRTDLDTEAVASVIEFIGGNDHFFLNLSMAACKSMLDAAHDIPNSTMITAMARNGVEFGLRVSGTGSMWHRAPAPEIDGLFFPGYSMNDAARDLGDSAITETAGLGGFAMAAAPAIVQFVGGVPANALAYSKEMGHITIGNSGAFTLPALNFFWHGFGHRLSQGGRYRNCAHHQHGHRSSRCGRRADRRRDCACPTGLLCRCRC